MPKKQVVRHIVDEMKCIGPRLIVLLDYPRKMVLRISNLTVTVDTHFIGLEAIGMQSATG